MVLIVLSFKTEEDRDKFEYIYSKYKNLLLLKAYGVLNDYMLAEDAVSEALLRIYKNLGKIDDPASKQSISFVVTIVKNVALTMLQKKIKNTAEELVVEPGDGFELEEHVVSALSEAEIYNVVGELGEEYKSVFLLKYAYDMSNKEIASMLDIAPNHVGVLLFRAKKKLAAMLKAQREEVAVSERA